MQTVNDEVKAQIENNPRLIFENRNIGDSGEMIPLLDAYGLAKRDCRGKIITKSPYRSAKLKGMEIKIYSNGRIILSGSIHVFWNNGTTNHNSFTKINFTEAVTDLEKELGISLKCFRITQMEFGVNVILPEDFVSPEKYLRHCFLHKTSSFEHVMDSQEGGYIRVNHKQYDVKIYDKSSQGRSKDLRVPDNLIRFEIKVKDAQFIRGSRLFVRDVADLLKLDFMEFRSLILKAWDDVLFHDYSKLDRRNKYGNKLYWSDDLLRQKSRSTFKKHRNKLREISHNGLKKTFHDLLNTKINALSKNSSCQTIAHALKNNS